MYTLPTAPPPPATSKRREAHAVTTENPVRHTFHNTVTFEEAGRLDADFYSFLANIGKGN